jgi:uncharacterized protein YndB with AHSA1/START domain
MSLDYEAEHRVPGKTSEDTDGFQGRFVELIPGERVVQAVEFDSKDPELAGEMTITWTFLERGSTHTRVVRGRLRPVARKPTRLALAASQAYPRPRSLWIVQTR